MHTRDEMERALEALLQTVTLMWGHGDSANAEKNRCLAVDKAHLAVLRDLAQTALEEHSAARRYGKIESSPQLLLVDTFNNRVAFRVLEKRQLVEDLT